MYLKIIFLVLQILVTFTYCDLSLERKEKLLNGFIDFYNNLPDEPFTCEEGTLQSAEPIDENNFNIEVTLRVADVHSLDTSKYMKCSATVQDLQDQGVTVVNNNYRCTEIESKPVIEEPVVTESAFVRKPVHLDNEVETNTGVTSGEQFIAVPREEPGAPCIGCATHVNPQAAGVTELATLAVRHLDRHEPNVRHKLNTVLDVERQVQIVNGVRYILTLLVDYNNCTQSQSDCEFSNVCKISVLEKPWIKLPRGGKYRAVLANNCTEEWQFGDNGEVINENDSNNKENNEVDIHPNGDDIIKAVHTEDVQAQQHQGKTLTDEEVKTIEEQIIPHSEFNEPSTTKTVDQASLNKQSDESVSKKHVFKASETAKPATENSINPSIKNEQSSLSEERKKTIDDLMHFFEFAGFGSETGNEKNTRMKRSFDRDLEAMLLTEDFQSLQKSISRGKYLYDLAQVMVDYLNEMDLVIKTRTLKNVVKADDENVNYQHFYYIQARVIIPCDKAVCEPVDTKYKICNGVIEATDKQHPHVLTAFCYDEEEEEETELNRINIIPFDDPLLIKLLQDSIKKMEKESTKPNALNISEIISATTQKVSGTLTKISMVIAYLNCSKDTPLGLRKNCSVAADLGSNVCEVVIHEKYELKERKIIYNCIERPVDVSYSGRINPAKINVDDVKLKEMIQEALQYLELQSNRNNKQKIVAINSVETQLNAGLVTEIQFVVGYTSCSSNTDVDVSTCPLLPNNPLRKCKAQIWDRTWIEDGRQFDVNCDDVSDVKEDENVSKRRNKRTVVGAELAKDVKNPKYKTLAQESLQKYLQTTGNTKRHTVVSVDNVTEQLVAGLLTRLDFTVEPTDESSNDVITCHSEIRDRPWLNVKEITVDCKLNDKLYRAKRQVPGGINNKDPNKPEYKQLAEESLQKYLQTAGNTKPHEVIKINKASEQVVAGTLTRLEFIVKPIDSDSGDDITCTSEIWNRPWLKKKEITVNCNMDSESNSDGETQAVNKYRKKRDLRWVGGESAKDAHDPKYKTLAEKSLEQYLQTTGNTKRHTVVSVDNVTEQSVAGLLTRLDFTVENVEETLNDVITCHSEIWVRSWLNVNEITVDCKLNDKLYRAKRQVPGGINNKDPNKPEYKQLAEESLQKYLQTAGNTKPHEVIKINKASEQVVAGTLTRLEFIVKPIDSDSGDDITCTSEIWNRPWLKKKEITVNCNMDGESNSDGETQAVNKYRKKRDLRWVGGESAKDAHDPKYKTLAEKSLEQYLQTTGNTKRHTVVSVDNVTEQSVAGLLTRLDFTVENVEETLNDVITCHSEIWVRSWLNVNEITVDCKLNDKLYRAKRQVPGGINNKDPNKPEYKQLAEESLQKYLQTAGNTKPHEVIKINKASEQVVAGTLTRLEFIVKPIDSDSGDDITCTSEIWNRPWLKKKEITVNCNMDGESNSDGEKQTVNKYRKKRDLNWVGGESAKDAHDPKYKTLAEKSLEQYLQTTGNKKSHEIVSVDKVSVQVVAGSLTRLEFTVKPVDASSEDIFSCNSRIWERPWLNKTEITVDCKISNKSNQAKATKRKREILHDTGSPNVQTVGDRDEQDPNKSQYKALAKDALVQYQRQKHSKNAHKVVEVKRVRSRVVSGLIYEIDFTAVPTSCPPRIFNPSLCKQKHNSRTLLCHTSIWHQAWMRKKEITVSCNPDTNQTRKKRSLDLEPETEFTGNDIESNIKDKRQVLEEEEVIDEELKYYYADRAMQQINQVSNTNNLHKLISIHAVDSSLHMGTNMVRLYIEIAETYCLKHADENDLPNCEELDGMTHKLCQIRLWPSPDDELVVQSISVVCDDDKNFATVTGLSIPELLTASIKHLESSPDQKFKLVHLGEPQVIPSLDSVIPHKVSFIIAFTNCTKDVDIRKRPFQCFLDTTKTSKPCTSYIWFAPNSREISHIDVKCLSPTTRRKRSVTMNLANATADDLQIHKLVQEALEKLEMSSIHRYKQRLLLINSYSSKITTGKVTTIDFDVGYTSCLKYEWVDDETTCEFLEHLPRRHCVAHVFERLWLQNGRNIDVNCEDDETPLEAHIEFESAEMAMQLANQALRHIEAKYPHPRKQKVVRIFSLEKQVVAGIHYRLKIEVGNTDCLALSAQTDCKIVKDEGMNKFCRVNVWLRPWTDHPPNFRVSCDYQETATSDTYHDLQAEHLFYDFLSTYKPEYVNDRNEIRRRFDIFKNNIIKIHELNTHERGTATYGVTQFTDLTYEEFTTRHMGLKTSLRNENLVPFTKAKIPEVSVPESFDWRDHGAVTEVKNQGSCGSCWAFSVTGNIEGQWKLHSGNLVSLSEQELVDCDKLDEGCNGGLPDNAYRAIEQLGGLETENDYPYEAEDDKCTFNKTLARVQISGAVNISSNETEMSKWLVQNGPISIGINANAMQFYMGGISHPWRMLCNPSNLDHGVLIVGYGVKNYPLFHKRLPYWTIKNSWGTSWGEQGYYRVYRGDGTCGVNQMASSAVI